MVLEIKVDARSAIKGLNLADKKIQRVVAETLKREGIQGKKFAQAIAPRKSGALRAGIGFNATKRKLKIFSVVGKAFPYNLWVNQDIRTIKGNWPFFRKGSRVLYGGRARSPSGKPIAWTGLPGFMTKTGIQIAKTLPKNLEVNLRRALR